MSLDSSVYVLCATAHPRPAIEVLSRLLPALGRHVYAVELCCPESLLGSARMGLTAMSQSWPAGPPLRLSSGGIGPGIRVRGLSESANEVFEEMHERVRELTHPGVSGVALLGVLAEDGGLSQIGLHLAMTRLARAEDLLCRTGDALQRLDFIRSQLLVGPCVPETVAKTSYQALCRMTDRPAIGALRGTLYRHLRGWTYGVGQGDEAVATVELSAILGASLAAVVREPSASVHRLFELACAPEFGWSIADRGDCGDPERVDARVRVWLTRLRARLAPWRVLGLQDFIPATYSRRVRGAVDIRFGQDLPWRAPPR